MTSALKYFHVTSKPSDGGSAFSHTVQHYSAKGAVASSHELFTGQYVLPMKVNMVTDNLFTVGTRQYTVTQV